MLPSDLRSYLHIIFVRNFLPGVKRIWFDGHHDQFVLSFYFNTENSQNYLII